MNKLATIDYIVFFTYFIIVASYGIWIYRRKPGHDGTLEGDSKDYFLAEGDDIIHFQYIKKNNKEKGPVFVGIEVKRPADVEAIKGRMGAEGFSFEYLNGQPDFLALLV